MESLKGITQFNTGSMIANGMKLSESAVNSYRASIDGLTLSQAQVALSSTALNNIQKEQILTSAGLLKSTEAVTLEEIKQMAASASLSAQKKEEILTTLQGAYSENQWNIEKLEAIVASGGEAGAIAQSILAKKAENAENIKNIAGSKALTASLWGQLKARLALMATNPAVWIAGIVGAGLGLIALENKFSKSLDECTEELDKLNSEFEQSQSEAESLESEWENCKTRLDELQKLADNGTISIIEQEEYERLQKTNDELERNLRIEKEKSQLSAIKGATTADETLTKRVQSQYIRGSVESYEGVVLEDQILSVFPEEELDAAIEEYQRIQVEIDELNKSYDNGEISTSDYEKQLGSLTEQQTKARTRASEMSDILSDCKQAYDNLNNTGGSFTTTQKNNYNAVTEANKRYNDFLGTINDVNETFENLDTTEKARTLKDRYAKKTLSLPNGQGTYTVDDKEISDWIDTLSDEDLKILGTINFSGEQTKDSMQEALDYAKIHTNANPDEITVPKLSISETIDQLNTQLKPAFDSLKDAYLDIFTLDDNGNEVFNLENVDLSMLDDIKSTIDELNENEELGISIDYSSFEDLSKTLMDNESTAEEVRESINLFATDIVNALNPALNQTTGENYKFVQSLLESLNIINSEAVMISTLGYSYEEYILAKEECAEAGFDLANATQDEIDAFMYEEDGAIKCGEALALLELKKQLVNGTLLDTNSDIENVLTLAKAAGITIESLDKLAIAKSKFDEAIKTGDGRLIGSAAIELQHAKDEVENAILDFEPVEVDFTPKQTDKKSSSSSKDTSKEFDWIERAIDNIEKKISRLNKISDSAYSSAGEKNKALADQIHLVNEEIQLQQQAYEGYMEKANSIGLSDDYKKLVQEGAINIEKITDKELQEAISNYSEWYEKAKETQDKITDLHEQSKDLRVEAADNGANELKELLDHQAITEREYIDRMNDLWEFYYANQVELAEVAKDRKLELLEEEKDYLENVANAASSILNYEIDELEEQKENAIKPYQDQIEEIKKKKKNLEDYLDDLEDERKHEELILNLQKAQYELERARSQRNKLVYKDGQMSYVTDDKAIRDAREKVDDAQFELVKFNIEQQIEAYDEQIDKLNELIEQTEKYYDDQIEGLEKTKNEWEKMIELQEHAMNITLFESMFGKGSVANLLTGDMSQIATWQKEFVDTLAEIDLTANGQIGEFTKQYADLANIDLSGLSEQTTTVASQFDALKESVDGATSAIAGTSGGGETKEGESAPNGEEQSGENTESTSTNSLVGAIDASYQAASEKLPAETEMMNGLTESTTVAMTEVNSLGEAINALPDEKTITINVVTNGSVGGIPVTPHAEGTVGKAFANGTGNYKGLAHAEKNALRSEYGQPELTVYPDGTTELTTEPTMSDLPKDTVIFNEEQTKRIMNNEGTIIGNAHADGNAVLQKAELPSYLRPIQEGDKGYELIKAARVYQDMLKTNIMLPVNSIDKNVEMMTRNISAVNTSNVNKPTVNVGGITVNCPAVNSKEIMNQVSTALHREIGGIALEALQEASITR